MKNITVITVVFVIAAVGTFLLINKSRGNLSSPEISTVQSPQVAALVSEQNIVTITENGFSPSMLTIKTGESVTWQNKSGVRATVNSDPHPTHTDYEPLNLGEFSDGESLNLTFDTPGTYSYHNHLNSSQTGTIAVE
jgi:plastocyanin